MIRLLHAYFPTRALFLGISEACLVSLAFLAATVARLGGGATAYLFDYRHGSFKILVASLAIVICMYYFDLYRSSILRSRREIVIRLTWETVRSVLLQIGSADKPVLVNEYIVEKGKMRDLVLYWYQTHGRIVASEYWAKFWLVADGLRHKSTDGAMIRIWTTAEDGEESAQARATDFARNIYPQVCEFLPN